METVVSGQEEEFSNSLDLFYIVPRCLFTLNIRQPRSQVFWRLNTMVWTKEGRGAYLTSTVAPGRGL